MSLKSALTKPVARFLSMGIRKWRSRPIETQEKVFKNNLAVGKKTAFGRDHGLDNVQSYEDFKKAVPIRDYEGLRPYIERITKGEQNVLWKGSPLYYAKTSGTTSGIKYIPVSKEGMPTFISAGRSALAMYVMESGETAWVNGGMIFIQGSPELQKIGAVNAGRMSGITYHHIPAYLRRNLTPTYETNTIEDWETKLDAIIDETLKRDMTVIGGIPPWVLMYFERLLERTGKKTVAEVFPNFHIYMFGGVNFTPYKPQFEKIIGKQVAYINTYTASEGFIAFTDTQQDDDAVMLLNVSSGIFYEFIPADELYNDNPTRITLKDVKVGVNYAIILNSNSGLWGYLIGDTVKFVSTDPYRLMVTGRTKHFTSAFGEHVIAEEVETAMKTVAEAEGIGVIEFTVAPQVNPSNNEAPYHEWFVEFVEQPNNLKAFAQKIDDLVVEQNVYYRDLIEGNMLQPLIIRVVPKDGFRNYMKSKGKLGGQNKVPRLSNTREVANDLIRVLDLKF